MGLICFDHTIYDYLDRKKNLTSAKIRQMTPEELEKVNLLRKTYTDIKQLVTEIICIIVTIEQLNDPRTYYIVRNLRRIINSVRKQNDLAWALKCTLSQIKPEGDEMKAIDKFIQKVSDRIVYLRTVVIPENLKLTPIQEYMDLYPGMTFEDIIYGWFGDKATMVEEQKKDDGIYQEFAEDILRVIRENGKENAYQERMEVYFRINQEKDELHKAEKKQADIQRKHELSEEGLLNFESRFYRAIRTLNADKEIGISEGTVERKLNKYSRNGTVLLCCYMFQNKYKYRYVSAIEKPTIMSRYFNDAHVYENEQEAAEVMHMLAEKYPDKAYDICRLSYLEESVCG